MGAAAAWRRAGRSGGRAGRRVSAPGRTTTVKVYIRTYSVIQREGKERGREGWRYRSEGDKNREKRGGSPAANTCTYRHTESRRMREGGNGGGRREGDKNREKRSELQPPRFIQVPSVMQRVGNERRGEWWR